jgi:hypothetical protein
MSDELHVPVLHARSSSTARIGAGALERDRTQLALLLESVRATWTTSPLRA